MIMWRFSVRNIDCETISIGMVWTETSLIPSINLAGKVRRCGRQFAMCGGSLCNFALGWKCRCVDEALIVEVVDIGACVPLAA